MAVAPMQLAVTLLLSAACSLWPSIASAQPGWPVRPPHAITPFPAGGINDVIMRVFADRLSAALGQPIVVEAKTGAAGNIGTDFVAKSAPDGYTWLASSFPFTVAPALFNSLPFDPIKDFRAVAMLATAPNVLAVAPDLPVSNLQEFVAYARRAPGGVSYASPGAGSSAHIGTEAFSRDAGFTATHVVYRGAPPALLDLMAGRVQMMMVSASLAAPQIAEGKLKGLAVMDTRRHARLPDIPTVAEAGFPIQPVVPWFALHVPAATPQPIIDRLNREIGQALSDPQVRERLQKAGATPASPMPPGAVDATLKQEAARWQQLASQINLQKQ